MKKCGYVTKVGKPNAGKSTLINTLLNFKLSIVNKKAQTTRNKILGVLTEKDYQIIFIDTPGIFEPKYELQKFMFDDLKSSLIDADVILFVVDCLRYKKEDIEEFYNRFGKGVNEKKIIFVLNKIDKSNNDEVNKITDDLAKIFNILKIIAISALSGFNINGLISLIIECLPESEFLYDPETMTDRPEKFFVAEIIRQKVLDLFEDEIPYSVFVDIREFNEREKGKDFINAEIIVERETQKGILLGKGGIMIKKLGQLARTDIENLLHREIFLQLFVKVRKDWKKDKAFLKGNFGK